MWLHVMPSASANFIHQHGLDGAGWSFEPENILQQLEPHSRDSDDVLAAARGNSLLLLQSQHTPLS